MNLFGSLFSEPQKKLYFLHIPKTAGTSVSNVLLRVATEKNLEMVGPILLDHLAQRPNWEKSDLLVGHLGLLPLDFRYKYFTVLRDPIERLYSHYCHVYRDPIHYHHKILAGEELNFEEYLLDQRFYNLNYNMQARYLSVRPKLDNSGREMIFAQKAFEFENSSQSDINFDLAIRTLENALCVGNSSNLSQLGKFFEKRFGIPNIKFPFLNSNPGNRKKFTYNEIQAAEPLIELDQILFKQYAI